MISKDQQQQEQQQPSQSQQLVLGDTCPPETSFSSTSTSTSTTRSTSTTSTDSAKAATQINKEKNKNTCDTMKQEQQYTIINNNHQRCSKNSHSSSSSSSNKDVMYGDLVNGLCYTAFLPAYLYLWLYRDNGATGTTDISSSNDDSSTVAPRNICAAFGATTVFHWLSYLSNDQRYSLLGFATMTLSIFYMNYYEWPHENEVVIVPQFVWSLLILTANYLHYHDNNNHNNNNSNDNSNSSTSDDRSSSSSSSRLQYYYYKSCMAIMALLNAVIICIIKPHCIDKLPMILAVFAMFALFHYRLLKKIIMSHHHHHNNKSRGNSNTTSSNASSSSSSPSYIDDDRVMSAHVASLILAGAFAYDAAYEMLSMYQMSSSSVGGGTSSGTGGGNALLFSTQGGYNILRIGFFATAGLLASGSFRREIEFKQRLEVLVQQRSGELQKQTQYLRVVEHAMQASETPIAITDALHTIIWCNGAFEKLTNNNKTIYFPKYNSNDNNNNNNNNKNTMVHDNNKSDENDDDDDDDDEIDNDNTEQKQQRQQEQQQTSLIDALQLQNPDHIVLLEQLYLGVVSGTGTITVHGKSVEVEVSPYPSSTTTNQDEKDDNENDNENENDNDSHNHVDDTKTTTTATPTTTAKRRFLVVLRDITERIAREKAEQAAEQEALISKAMMESMQTLSHELRTPLQSIMGMTSLLLEDTTLPEDATESMFMVMTSSRLLLTLINNMLDKRKCDAGSMDQFHLGPLSLETALCEAVDFCRPFASISDVDLTVVLDSIQHPLCAPGKSIMVQSNPLRFQQIMINLLSNAIKHSPRGATVYISAQIMSFQDAQQNLIQKALVVGDTASKSSSAESHPSGGISPEQLVAVISVADQGHGIPEKQKSMVFRRFAQLDRQPATSISGLAQPTGTGLGLNLCTEFIGRMNGEIWVSNKDPNNVSSDNNKINGGGTGACFSFYLPLASPSTISSNPTNDPNHESATNTKLNTSTTAFNDSHSHSSHNRQQAAETKPLQDSPPEYRVLLVDDTLINLKVLKRMLKRLGIEQISTADCGYGALECLDSPDANYNLVITDLQMPRMDGIELSKTIRKRQYSWDPLVVGLTADTSESVEHECLESGMALVLHKPLTQRGLFDFFESIADQVKP